MNTVDIRIMGVRERMDMVLRNKQILNLSDDHIFIDEKRQGIRFNATRAWLYPTEESHVLVLSDDTELCGSFQTIINTMVNN